MLKKTVLYTMIFLSFTSKFPKVCATETSPEKHIAVISEKESEQDNDTAWIRFKTDYKDSIQGNIAGTLEKHDRVRVVKLHQNDEWAEISWIKDEIEINAFIPVSAITYDNPSERELYMKDSTGNYAKYVFNDSDPNVIDKLIEDFKQRNSKSPDNDMTEENTKISETEVNPETKEDESSEYADEENTQNKEEYNVTLEFIIGLIIFIMIILLAVIIIGMGGESQ